MAMPGEASTSSVQEQDSEQNEKTGEAAPNSALQEHQENKKLGTDESQVPMKQSGETVTLETEPPSVHQDPVADDPGAGDSVQKHKQQDEAVPLDKSETTGEVVADSTEDQNEPKNTGMDELNVPMEQSAEMQPVGAVVPTEPQEPPAINPYSIIKATLDKDLGVDVVPAAVVLDAGGGSGDVDIAAVAPAEVGPCVDGDDEEADIAKFTASLMSSSSTGRALRVRHSDASLSALSDDSDVGEEGETLDETVPIPTEPSVYGGREAMCFPLTTKTGTIQLDFPTMGLLGRVSCVCSSIVCFSFSDLLVCIFWFLVFFGFIDLATFRAAWQLCRFHDMR
jgi:hypothetical protein